MKEFIVGLGISILFILTLAYQTDTHLHQEFKVRLKVAAEEAAAAGAQYFSRERYGDGYYVFNEAESKKAIKHLIQSYLKLNDDLSPTEMTYWNQSGNIKYEVTFVNSDDQSFPTTINVNHFGIEQSHILFGPSVIVTINAGKARYKLIDITKRADNLTTAIHTFEE